MIAFILIGAMSCLMVYGVRTKFGREFREEVRGIESALKSA